MKRIAIILISVLTFCMCSCSKMTVEEKAEYERKIAEREANKPRYEYEIAEAEIIDIRMKKVFTRLDWYIQVKYEQYQLQFEERGHSVGIWNAPSFYGKKVGDLVEVEIENTYKKEQLIDRRIIDVR